MKSIKKIIILLIVIALAAAYSFVDNTENMYDVSNEDTNRYISTGPIYKDTFSIPVIPHEDSLDAVSLKSGIVGDVSNVTVKYRLLDNKKKVVAEGSVAAQEIEDRKQYKFSFEKVEGCRDKQYCFEICEENASEESGVAFYYDPQDNMKQSIEVMGEKEEGAVIAKLVTHRFDVKTFIIVLCFVAYLAGFTKILYKLFK